MIKTWWYRLLGYLGLADYCTRCGRRRIKYGHYQEKSICPKCGVREWSNYL